MRRRMDDKKKKLIMGALAIFLALIFVLGMIAPFMQLIAAENESMPVSLQVETGMDGVCKTNRPMPVTLF